MNWRICSFFGTQVRDLSRIVEDILVCYSNSAEEHKDLGTYFDFFVCQWLLGLGIPSSKKYNKLKHDDAWLWIKIFDSLFFGVSNGEAFLANRL